MLHTMVTIVVAAVLGATACCLPVIVWAAIEELRGQGDGQFGLGIVFAVLVLGPVGMVSGLVGGFIYRAGQRFMTAASPCLGIAAGTTIAVIAGMVGVRMNSLPLLLIAGGVVGVIYAVLSWQPKSQPDPPPDRSRGAGQ
jgi:hypothetical protein